jgi:glutamyl-tRNA synthetase
MTSGRAFRTRLAPSPTGDLHLGNARTFVLTWLLARQRGGAIVLRVEDLDRRRVKPGSIEEQIDQLRWLGLDWDEGPIVQSARTQAFEHALARLESAGRVYPCICSRKDVEAVASAPQPGDGGPRYPGTCRGRFPSFAAARSTLDGRNREPAWRFVVDGGPVAFDDGCCGRTAIDVGATVGDFPVRSADGQFSYQLAVVVDDAAMGISDVIRGADLLSSAPRQILLHRALGFEPPRFTHLPLVLARDGDKLSKRRRDLDLAALRARGVAAERVVGWIASSAGMKCDAEVAVRELIGRFDLAALARDDVLLDADPF